MKKNNHSQTVAGAAALLALTLMFCQGQKASPPQGDVAAVTPIESIQDSIQLIGYTVHQVKLTTPYVTNDAKGNSKKYEQAWLVKMELGNMPKYTNRKIDFFIGDYAIKEYGGWERGIYFRIYDKVVLDQLGTKEIRYRSSTSDSVMSTHKIFELPADKKFIMEDENKVLGKQ